LRHLIYPAQQKSPPQIGHVSEVSRYSNKLDVEIGIDIGLTQRYSSVSIGLGDVAILTDSAIAAEHPDRMSKRARDKDFMTDTVDMPCRNRLD